jgi:decaprenylphospho-beta-D-erythro-pentofuranosid-2-ulose 2-reductase
MQRILVLGGKSDLAISILKCLPLSVSAEIILCGREISSFSVPEDLGAFQIHKVESDFTDLSVSNSVIESIFKEGDIDLVILAYAILGNEDSQLEPNLFAEVLNTNFYSQAILLNLVNSKMVSQMYGQILLISSVAGMRPRKRNFVYGASKFGVDFIAQGLQKQNIDKNVFISILRPGFVFTKMSKNSSPAPFATNRKAAAQLAANGLRKKKRVVYAPKILLLVMFTLKLLPERIFRSIDK